MSTANSDLSEMTDEQIRVMCQEKATEGQQGIVDSARIVSANVQMVMTEVALATTFLIQELSYFRELEILLKTNRLGVDRMNDIFNHIANLRSKVAELAKQRVSSKQ